jgi:hypothetical protein
MQIPSRFIVEEFQLELNHSALLVEVSPANGNGDVQDFGKLPRWVFHSKHAIWLTAGTKPIVDRAIAGEHIKHTLLQKFSNLL